MSDSNLNLTTSRRSMMKLFGMAGVGAVAAPTALTAANAAPIKKASPQEIAIMSSNENPFGPSPKAVKAMKAELENIYRYSRSGVEDFTTMIAEREGVAPEQVMVANGSSPILGAFAEWVSVQGGDLVTSMTTYEGVPRTAEYYNVNVIYVPLDADMGYDLEAIAAAVGPNTTAVYLCNPNNPTGRTIDPVQLKAFVEDVSAKVPVFVDEAYLDMADDFPAGVMTEFVRAGRPVVVARTFSKLYAMAGQRLGYAILPAEMNEAMRASGRLSYTNHLGLIGAMASLEDEAYFNEMRMKTARGRAKLVAMAEDLGRPYAPDPQGSFIYMDTGMKASDFSARMMEKGVRVVGSRWSELPNWSRICVGHDWEIERCHEAAKSVMV